MTKTRRPATTAITINEESVHEIISELKEICKSVVKEPTEEQWSDIMENVEVLICILKKADFDCCKNGVTDKIFILCRLAAIKDNKDDGYYPQMFEAIFERIQ